MNNKIIAFENRRTTPELGKILIIMQGIGNSIKFPETCLIKYVCFALIKF